MSFTHLHLHTQYSLLDGATLLPDLMKHLQKLKMSSCAITDHGWMAGVVDFYKQCKASDIKPLIGCEAYVTEDEDGLENVDKKRDNYHLVLIAKDHRGFSDLLRLVSNAATSNFYYKPRICERHLKELSGHVIATTACLGGVLAKRLHYDLDQYGRVKAVQDIDKKVQKKIEEYASIFNGDFYLELQDWPDENLYQQSFNQFIIPIGKAMKLPFVITSDAHYLTREDEKLHQMLMAMQLKTTVGAYKDQEEMKYGPHFYVKSPEEMLKSAQHLRCEEAYYNTEKIAERCNVDIELGVYKPPSFKIEEADDYEEFMKWREKHIDKIECGRTNG